MDQLEIRIEELKVSTNSLQKKVADQQVLLEQLMKEYRLQKEATCEDKWDFDRLKGKLCVFWDQENDFTHTMKGGMIRPFSRREYKPQEAPGHHFRYYALDIMGEQEVGHGWRNFKPFTIADMPDRLITDPRKFLK